LLTVNPFSGYTGVLSVALGDVNGDGFADVITAARGAFNGRVKIYDGQAAQAGNAVVLANFVAFNNYTGGLSVAAGGVNGDGQEDVAVGTRGNKTASVAVYDGAQLSGKSDSPPPRLGSAIKPFGSYTGNVFVAAGDTDGDGQAEVQISKAS